MDKRLWLILPCLAVSPLQAKQKEKEQEQVAALSEEFLLFLAEVEDVEGELVHPVDLAQNKPNETKVAQAKDKTMKQTKKGEQDDIK